jgi:3-hydroxybutyrate dehydrogenase
MLTAPFIAMKHAFPIMKKQQFGRIINMASVNGTYPGQSALTVMPSAAPSSAPTFVKPMTPCLALSYADQLKDISATRNVPYERVLEDVIFPLVPQKRLLSVKEIADYAVFLASDKAKGITGLRYIPCCGNVL